MCFSTKHKRKTKPPESRNCKRTGSFQTLHATKQNTLFYTELIIRTGSLCIIIWLEWENRGTAIVGCWGDSLARNSREQWQFVLSSYDGVESVAHQAWWWTTAVIGAVTENQRTREPSVRSSQVLFPHPLPLSTTRGRCICRQSKDFGGKLSYWLIDECKITLSGRSFFSHIYSFYCANKLRPNISFTKSLFRSFQWNQMSELTGI